MKRITEAFKGARKLEWVLALILVAIAVVILLEQGISPGSVASEDELRLERLLSQIDGTGQVSVLLSGKEGEYNGCVVIAEGADDVRIFLKLQRAIQTAMNIPAENIEIIATEG